MKRGTVIALLIIGILCFIVGIAGLIYIENTKEYVVQTGDCFDRHGSKMLGITCEVTENDFDKEHLAFLILLLFGFTLILIETAELAFPTREGI